MKPDSLELLNRKPPLQNRRFKWWEHVTGKTLLELIDAEELLPVLSAMQSALGVGMEQTKTVFITVFLCAHGYASMIANNELKYDEDTINSHLERAYRGAILAAQEEMA